MWVLVFFDFPMDSNEQKRNYVGFRNLLLREGFEQIQYSVYACFCLTKSKSEYLTKRLVSYIPREGHVRILNVTAKQYSEMTIYVNLQKKKAEKEEEQLVMF